ncbi:hypothetical protein [Vibrio sp. WXL103]|uniref:hypothetical protein n=1 Tax=Vibrio sp. WXL103 TaxID=3450710 RepID=UPI003EC7C70C
MTIKINTLNRNLKLALLACPILLTIGCNATDEAESEPRVVEAASLQFSDMARHSLDLIIASDNPEEYFWDDHRIARTSDGEKFIEYIVPGHVRNIDLTAYYDYGIVNKKEFRIEVSKNGVDYQKINYFFQDHGESPNWWLSKMVGSAIVNGDGFDHVRVTFPKLDYLVDGQTKPATPQIGQLSFGYDPDESLASDNVLGQARVISGGYGELEVSDEIADATHNNFQHYITRGDGNAVSRNASDSTKLYEGAQEFRFVSFNIPNLFVKERPWQRVDPFEIADALKTINAMGGKVTRTYVPSIENDRFEGPYHVSFAPNGALEFNEELWQDFDLMLDLANQHGVRLIVPLIDFWDWWGGIEQLANNRGVSKAGFYTNAKVKADYKRMVSYILNRVNTISGVAYKDDPAIFAWETGNELMDVPDAWTKEMSAYIKSIDSKHLLMDGQYGMVSTASAMNPNVDILSNHYYWANQDNTDNYAERFMRDWNNFGAIKPFFVGEVGLASTDKLTDVVESVVDSGAMGIMLWSLRQQAANGGYLNHDEGHGFMAYHWPGFAENAGYDEQQIIDLVWTNAYAIDGSNRPELPAPNGDPVMLPIENVGDIRWQGVTNAQTYNVERRTIGGSWQEVGSDIVTGSTNSDNFITVDGFPYQLLFGDYSAELGETYEYRVTACNVSGCSYPSEPVEVTVDQVPDYPEIEFSDNFVSFDYMHDYDSDNLGIDTGNSELFYDDTSRVKRYSQDNSSVSYLFESPLSSLELVSYFQNHTVDGEQFTITVAKDAEGTDAKVVSLDKDTFHNGWSDYTRVAYNAEIDLEGGYHYLEIEFPITTGDEWAPQLGQLTISREGGPTDPDAPPVGVVVEDRYQDLSLVSYHDEDHLFVKETGGDGWIFHDAANLLTRQYGYGEGNAKVGYQLNSPVNTIELVTYYHTDLHTDDALEGSEHFGLFEIWAWNGDDADNAVQLQASYEIDNAGGWYDRVIYKVSLADEHYDNVEYRFPANTHLGGEWGNAEYQAVTLFKAEYR